VHHTNAHVGIQQWHTKEEEDEVVERERLIEGLRGDGWVTDKARDDDQAAVV